MREKKARGLKRKTNNMITRMEQETLEFPSDFYNGYWSLPLPVSESFINSSNTPFEIKRLLIQTLLDRLEHLIRIKPNNNERYRVVASINITSLWNSQIIVFIGNSYFNGFFDRNEDFQKWIQLSKERNIETEWGLSVSDNLQIKGYKEEVTDEEGNKYDGEIWFIGELNRMKYPITY